MTAAVVSSIGVVIPARDEEAALPATLRSLERAVAEAAGVGVSVRVLLVLDRCQDGSAALAARWPGVEAVTCDVGAVGAARRLGCQRLLHDPAVPAPDWLATTDADTVVPPLWLVRQAELADAGADVVVGTVEPDVALAESRARHWWRRHHLAERHGYVHGANLGVRAAAYEQVGGFAPLATGEDRDLVARLRAAGARSLATDTTRVTTSSRTTGRAPDGFAAYLRALPT